MRTRLVTVCLILFIAFALCSAENNEKRKGGGGGGRGGSSTSGGFRGSSSSSSSSFRYSSSSSSGYYSSGGYYYTGRYYRSSSGLSNAGSCDKVCGIAVGSVIGGLAGLFLFTFLIIFGLSFCKDSIRDCCDSVGDCCDCSSSSSGGSSSYGGSGGPSSTPDIAMMTEVKVHTPSGDKAILPVYSNRWMDPDCKPESYYQGVFHEAPAEAFAASNEFNRQYPPQNVLPPDDHINWIVSQGGANAWRFGPDLEATWRVQRKTRAEDGGRYVVFENSEDAMMQTNYPFFCPTPNSAVDTLNETLFYFEGTIVKKASGSSTVAFGLATKPYPAYRLPGWNLNSVGYHSDDGHKFLNDGYGGQSYGPVYGQGDTIGVGYNPSTGNVFFTKNGKHLGDAFRGQKHVFFPCIGSDGHAEISVNFGDNPERPYAYSDANGYGPGGLFKNIPTSAPPANMPSPSEITV